MTLRTQIAVLALAGALCAPVAASAKISKALRAELDGYVEPLKGEGDPVARQAVFLARAVLEGRASAKDLEAATKDENKRVRLAAGIAWYMTGDKKAEAFLRAELASDAGLLDTLNELVAVLPDKTEAKLLGEIWKSATPEIKMTLARYMAVQKGPVFDLLGSAITGKDDADRKVAVQAVVFANNKEGFAPLQKLLKTKNPAQRLEATLAFVQFSRNERLESDARAILSGLLNDSDPIVQGRVVERMIELRDPAAIAGALGLIKGAKESTDRQTWMSLLLDNGQYVPIEAVTPYLKAEDMNEKRLAHQLAASSKDPKFVESLVKMEQSTTFEDRVLAIESLGFTGSEKATPILSRTLFEGRKDVRLATAKSLEKLGRVDALPALERALKGEQDQTMKLAVIDAIGSLKSPKALQALRFLVTNSDLKVKEHTLRAIRHMALPEGAQALEVLFRDRNTDIQWLAFLTAMELKPDLGMKNIKTALRNPPSTYIDDVRGIRGDNAKKQVFEYLLTQTTGSAQSDAIKHALTHGGFDEILRKLALDPTVSVGDRKTILLSFAATGGDAEWAVIERAVRGNDSKQLSQLAAWLLVRNPSDKMEPTFRGNLSQKDVAIKSLALYGIAAANQ